MYGIGGDATNDRAVADIFAAKSRPRFNPLIVHVPGLAEAETLAVFDDRARRLARRFWPGPLTLVLPRLPGGGVSLLASAGLDTVAVRVPAHPVAQALLRAVGRPVAAPSANRSGRVSPTTAAHVCAEFAAATGGSAPAMILDGGPCSIGVEFTVLDLTGPLPVLLRPGGVTLEDLAEILGTVETPPPMPAPPRRVLRAACRAITRPTCRFALDATEARPGEALLAFGPEAPPGFAEILFLSRGGDLAEAAANLFAMLRRLDRPEFSGIAVMPIPERGLGQAINDRLRRAAAPRPGGD